MTENMASLLARLDAGYTYEAPGWIGPSEQWFEDIAEEYPRLRAIVQAAVALSGFSPWVHGEETTVASQCWVCAGWRKHEDDCEWIALVSAVRGEDS